MNEMPAMGRDGCTTLFLSLLIIDLVRSLKLSELYVPVSVQRGERAQLSCHWQLAPSEVLYSVKWYKDGKEFFRHVPGDIEPEKKFPRPGVDVEESDSFGANLTLAPASLQTSGRYRCEVSGEKPFFPTVSKHADMQIIVLPDQGPILSGVLQKYRVGDILSANCTSGKSRPPTNLTWYINGERIHTNNPINFKEYEDGLTVTISTIELDAKDTYFKGNQINVKCLATLDPIYWKSKEKYAVKEWGVTATRSEITNNHASFGSDSRQENNASNSTRYNLLFLILPTYHNIFTGI